jgi:hypothetical protein
VLGKGGRVVAGEQEQTRPDPPDVGSSPEFVGAGQLVSRLTEPPITEAGPGPGQVGVAAGLDGGYEGQVGAAPATGRPGCVVRPTDGTA